MTTEDEIYYEMKRIATANNLVLTDNAVKIARFRARKGLEMSKCPCEQNALDRGCIGPKCWEEINRDGICLCQCFKRNND